MTEAHNRITEAELFQGYSGLRFRGHRPPAATPETVRRRLADAVADEVAPGADSRDPVASPDVASAEATRR